MRMRFVLLIVLAIARFPALTGAEPIVTVNSRLIGGYAATATQTDDFIHDSNGTLIFTAADIAAAVSGTSSATSAASQTSSTTTTPSGEFLLRGVSLASMDLIAGPSDTASTQSLSQWSVFLEATETDYLYNLTGALTASFFGPSTIGEASSSFLLRVSGGDRLDVFAYASPTTDPVDSETFTAAGIILAGETLYFDLVAFTSGGAEPFSTALDASSEADWDFTLSLTARQSEPTPIPEPASLLLLTTGLGVTAKRLHSSGSFHTRVDPGVAFANTDDWNRATMLISRRAGLTATAGVKRREFLTTSALAVLGAAASANASSRQATAGDPIIDIHQHLGYSGRPNEVLIAHQRAIGATQTVLLPAGRDTRGPSTHNGVANGLQARARGSEECYQFARSHERFLFGANEVPDLAGATREIEQYLKRGAKVIGEQKFGVECDSPQMQAIYRLAGEYNVPVLMHWQFKMYNYGFERFHTMLEKFPRVKFVGHAQMWWANIDRNYKEPSVSYPKGAVAVGGLTDRYLSDYTNMYGDLSAGSGLNALTRDEDFARDFVRRHRDKLVFGSDCSCHDGGGAKCLGSQIVAAVRRLAADRPTERKLLYENAKTVFRL